MNTPVTDLAPVANLIALQLLDLMDTPVTDLAPIANLTALQSLDLEGTQVTDFAPIANLTSLSASAIEYIGSLSWPSSIRDRVLQDLTSRSQPDSTVLGINHLRRLQGLPLFWPEGYEGERELPPIDDETRAVETIAETSLENLPSQAAAPVVFIVDGTGPIRLAPEPVSPYDPAQAELHEELVEAVSRLKGAIAERAGKTDRLAGLGSDVEAFAEALGGGLQAMRPRRAWMRGNALRRLHDADLRARASQDPDDAPLPEWTAARLEVVVMGYNAFAIGDPTLCELDRQSLGPVDRAQLAASVEASETLAQASLQAPEVMEKEAAERLVENAALARVASGSAGPNADRLLTETLAAAKNAGAAILRQLVLVARAGAKEGYKRWDEFAGGLAKKAGESIGSVAGPTILTFVAAHYGVLSALLPAAGATALLDLARKAAEEKSKKEE